MPVVSDFENEVASLLDFCGLPFEQDCLAFDRNTSPVATASSLQVRQPLNRSALARRRKYKDDLMPALDILTDHGFMDRKEID